VSRRGREGQPGAPLVDREVDARIAAFVDGKDAARRGTSPVEYPARWRGHLAATWLRGWTFEARRINGERPLDSVRVKP
jgi:hypothetical protein